MEFIKKFQEGGAMPQDPNAAAGAPQGGEDPTAMLMQGAQQAEGAGPEAAAPEQGEPVYRTGGRLIRRIKK